jgi:hypothetical protein
VINRKLYLRSNIIGIAVILVVLGVYFLYKTNVLSHDGIDFVSLRMYGIFSGSLWGGILSSIITLTTSYIVLGWLLWLSIFENIFNIISRRDDTNHIKKLDKSTYRIVWITLLVSHILTFICDLIVKSMPWDNRPKFHFAYSSDQIMVLVVVLVLTIIVNFYSNSRKLISNKYQETNTSNDVTSTHESLEITTEVKGV